MLRQIVLETPAKINLSLDITGRRTDGYHTLRSVFQAVGIYDRLTLTRTSPDEPLQLFCDSPDVPCDARNLVWKAAEALLGEKPCGFTIRLEKQIPSQAGMGGGSSDCAAALLGIRKLFALPVSDAELLEKAAKLGADVPFFLCGGTALCEGIGEILTPLKQVPVRELIMAKGSEGVSTPEGYRRLDALETQPPLSTEQVLTHLRDDADTLFSICGNWFDAVTDLPEVEQIRRIMQAHGIHPVLSGSGAAVFGGCGSSAQPDACLAALKEAGFPFAVRLSTVSSGVLTVSERFDEES